MKLKKNGLNANWDKVREQITKEYGVKQAKQKMYKVSYYHYFNEDELKEFMRLQGASCDEDQLDKHDSLGQMLVDAIDGGSMDWSNLAVKEEEVE